MQFSIEQQNAFDKYVAGDNIFVTGPGGTGKTALIKSIYKHAIHKGTRIYVCALTGCAAILLECKAKTVHSWAGIGLGKKSIEDTITRVMRNKFIKSVWLDTDVLVVDEVSMMSQQLFELLDAVGKAVRKNNEPFGGIQLVFSGDFYQLPPVGDQDQPETVRFCFESPLWFQTFHKRNHVVLHHIFRQTNEIYQSVLNQLREGRLKRSTNNLLIHLVENPPDLSGYDVKPTKLFPTRAMVDYVNREEMNKLTGQAYEYEATDHTDIAMTAAESKRQATFTREQIQAELAYLRGNLRVSTKFTLKVGAQVMCVVNMKSDVGDILLCNGSQGVIVNMSEDGYPEVQFHNKVKMVMRPFTWASETIPGVGVSQVPLILAWALTIHKSQGCTLDLAEVDAGSGIFECGQTYVALSRVRSLEGLYLKSFDIERVRINKNVKKFYESLHET